MSPWTQKAVVRVSSISSTCYTILYSICNGNGRRAEESIFRWNCTLRSGPCTIKWKTNVSLFSGFKIYIWTADCGSLLPPAVSSLNGPPVCVFNQTFWLQEREEAPEDRWEMFNSNNPVRLTISEKVFEFQTWQRWNIVILPTNVIGFSSLWDEISSTVKWTQMSQYQKYLAKGEKAPLMFYLLHKGGDRISTSAKSNLWFHINRLYLPKKGLFLIVNLIVNVWKLRKC